MIKKTVFDERMACSVSLCIARVLFLAADKRVMFATPDQTNLSTIFILKNIFGSACEKFGNYVPFPKFRLFCNVLII